MFKLLLLLLLLVAGGYGSQSFLCSGAEYAQAQTIVLVPIIDFAYGDAHS
jgi:hypothetical protein